MANLVKRLVAVAAVLLVPGVAAAAPSGGVLLAYVDPGAGSFLLQAMVAALAGIIVTVNVYWRKIKSLFGIGPAPEEAESSGDGDSKDG